MLAPPLKLLGGPGPPGPPSSYAYEYGHRGQHLCQVSKGKIFYSMQNALKYFCMVHYSKSKRWRPGHHKGYM